MIINTSIFMPRSDFSFLPRLSVAGDQPVIWESWISYCFCPFVQCPTDSTKGPGEGMRGGKESQTYKHRNVLISLNSLKVAGVWVPSTDCGCFPGFWESLLLGSYTVFSRVPMSILILQLLFPAKHRCLHQSPPHRLFLWNSLFQSFQQPQTYSQSAGFTV